MRITLVTILSILLFFSCKEEEQIILQSNNSIKLQSPWYFHQEGKGESYQATVPGVVHLDLYENSFRCSG